MDDSHRLRFSVLFGVGCTTCGKDNAINNSHLGMISSEFWTKMCGRETCDAKQGGRTPWLPVISCFNGISWGHTKQNHITSHLDNTWYIYICIIYIYIYKYIYIYIQLYTHNIYTYVWYLGLFKNWFYIPVYGPFKTGKWGVSSNFGYLKTNPDVTGTGMIFVEMGNPQNHPVRCSFLMGNP